jgi:hypothetical protein
MAGDPHFSAAATILPTFVYDIRIHYIFQQVCTLCWKARSSIGALIFETAPLKARQHVGIYRVQEGRKIGADDTVFCMAERLNFKSLQCKGFYT